MKLRYWIALIIGVIVLASVLYYSITPVEDIEEDGLPAVTMRLEIQKFEPEANVIIDSPVDIANIEWEIKDNDDVPTPIASKVYPSTVQTVGIPFVEPNSIYILNWYIDVVIYPQSPAVDLIDTNVKITGYTLPGLIPAFGGNPGLYRPIATPDPIEKDKVLTREVEESFEFSDAIPPSHQRVWEYPGYGGVEVILGSYLDGSTFFVNVTGIAQIDPTIFGVMSQECVIEVGAGGTLDVQITGISASTTDA